MTISVTVTLTPVAANTAEGRLEGHPASPLIRTHRIGDALSVEMFDNGVRCGEGILRRVDGRWVGACAEYAGEWRVTGAIGSGVLVFSDPPVPTDPQDQRVQDPFAEPEE